jgi:hypothetical protein
MDLPMRIAWVVPFTTQPAGTKPLPCLFAAVAYEALLPRRCCGTCSSSRSGCEERQGKPVFGKRSVVRNLNSSCAWLDGEDSQEVLPLHARKVFTMRVHFMPSPNTKKNHMQPYKMFINGQWVNAVSEEKAVAIPLKSTAIRSG